MADIESSKQENENNLLDRILAAESVVVALRCDDAAIVTHALRRIARRTGKPLYAWDEHAGLRRLSARDELMPGVLHLADALRLVERSPGLGVCFLAKCPHTWSAELVTLLRRIARLDPHQPRRLVLPGTLADLPRALPARELAWGKSVVPQLRLRHGAWMQ
ncbi:MAG: hypothetical protein ACTHJP_07945 [Rhodanobacteraceae bacterium]